jgi:hypothetical protein
MRRRIAARSQLIEIACKESANFKPVWGLIFTKLTRKKKNFKPGFRRNTSDFDSFGNLIGRNGGALRAPEVERMRTAS